MHVFVCVFLRTAFSDPTAFDLLEKFGSRCEVELETVYVYILSLYCVCKECDFIWIIIFSPKSVANVTENLV